MTLRIINSDPALLFGKYCPNSPSLLFRLNKAISDNLEKLPDICSPAQNDPDDTNYTAYLMSDQASDIRKARIVSTKRRVAIANENQQASKSTPLFNGIISIHVGSCHSPKGANINGQFAKLLTR